MSLRLDRLSVPSARCAEVIVESVGEVYGLSTDQICSKRRDTRTAEARMLCMYLVRRSVDLPLQGGGRIFGGRHHGTVIHAVRTIHGWLECDRRFRLRAIRVGEFVLGRVGCADTRELADSIIEALSVGGRVGIEVNNEQMEFCVA